MCEPMAYKDKTYIVRIKASNVEPNKKDNSGGNGSDLYLRCTQFEVNCKPCKEGSLNIVNIN